jgi:hypothetical protein
MKVATVTLRQKSTGKIKTVNQNEYATDLGKAQFAGWELLREDHNNDAAAVVEPVVVEEVVEEVIEDAATEEDPEEDPIDDDEEDFDDD